MPVRQEAACSRVMGVMVCFCQGCEQRQSSLLLMSCGRFDFPKAREIAYLRKWRSPRRVSELLSTRAGSYPDEQTPPEISQKRT